MARLRLARSGSGVITFATVAPDESRDAYYWHRGFSSGNDSLFPRSRPVFEAIVMNGNAWSARNDRGGYLALAYAHFDKQEATWELGGLMVAASERRKGLGSILMRLTLGHLLFEENPLELNHKIIAHVLKSNEDPRPIIQHSLKFQLGKEVEIPAHLLPGLRANAAGLIEGDEFCFVVPDSLISLANWFESWDGRLKTKERVKVTLRPKVSLKHWAAAFHRMAEDYVD